MQPVQPYESYLGQYLYGGQAEKSFIDKTLARSDAEEIKEIMQKEDLTRQDLLKLLYLLSGVETKLLNFGSWDRYLQGKFYAWIRDFVACAESLYDYKEKIEERKLKVNENTVDMLENIRVKMLHNIKFLCDVYLYLGRSTLSLEAVAFDTITTNRYEYSYPGQQQIPAGQESKRGLFNIKIR